ncbi:MAG: acireductone synthase [Granulosicoccus sp.]
MNLPAIVLDIEGTTSSTCYVHETLYPYAQQRFVSWLTHHQSDEQVAEQLNAIRSLADEPDASLERIVWWLNYWLEDDQKVTPLKAIQGWIWDEGFKAGKLKSHFYDDAIPVIRRWHTEGRRLFIFSSGSVAAQHAWFGHTPDGDLLPLFSGHFDTENLGPKRVASSYRLIAERTGFDVQNMVFLSDLQAELDAAREAGWHTVGVSRKGDQYYEQGVGDHLRIESFDQLNFEGTAPQRR